MTEEKINYAELYGKQFDMIYKYMPIVSSMSCNIAEACMLQKKMHDLDVQLPLSSGDNYKFFRYRKALYSVMLHAHLDNKNDRTMLEGQMYDMDEGTLITACIDYERMLYGDVKTYCSMLKPEEKLTTEETQKIMGRLTFKFVHEVDDDAMLNVIASAPEEEKESLAETIPLWLATKSAICLYKHRTLRRELFINTFNEGFIADDTHISVFGLLEKGTRGQALDN